MSTTYKFSGCRFFMKPLWSHKCIFFPLPLHWVETLQSYYSWRGPCCRAHIGSPFFSDFVSFPSLDMLKKVVDIIYFWVWVHVLSHASLQLKHSSSSSFNSTLVRAASEPNEAWVLKTRSNSYNCSSLSAETASADEPCPVTVEPQPHLLSVDVIVDASIQYSYE